MTPLRMSYLERYRAEQRGYVERAMEASYAYAKRILAGLEGSTLSADAAVAVENLRAAMDRSELIASYVTRLYIAAPWAFANEHAHA